MNDDSPPAGQPRRPAGTAASKHGRSKHNPAVRPARFLGPKAVLKPARHLWHRQQPGAAGSPTRTDIRLATADAAFSYQIRGLGESLYVERRQRRPLGALIVQSMIFSSREEFLRWCDADPLRFHEPNLHRRLRRHGEEHFDGRR